MVPWPDGTVLLGATSEDAGFDERATVAGVRDLLDAACELVPQTWQSGFRSARVGLRPASPDDMPIVGRSEKIPGLVYATAHFRNGILLAPLTGHVVGNLIAEGADDPALRLMSPQRFGTF
jgi:glycine oxidase